MQQDVKDKIQELADDIVSGKGDDRSSIAASVLKNYDSMSPDKTSAHKSNPNQTAEGLFSPIKVSMLGTQESEIDER